MELGTFVWTTLGAMLTLAIFSFLYKDNPFYKFAEHLVVGVSAGYWAVILWHNGLVPNLFERLKDGDWYYLWANSSRPWYLVPALLGILMWTRFSKKYSWISRWPIAMYIGIATGVAIPLEMSNRVNKQLYAAMAHINWGNFLGTGFLDTAAGFSEIIVFVGTIAGLIYFFFSKAHTGTFGVVAKVGIYILMIGFGASFGLTVMARISLFIQRIQFMHEEWAMIAFDRTNPNYNGWFQFFFWLVAAIVVGYIIRELVSYLRNKDKTHPESV